MPHRTLSDLTEYGDYFDRVLDVRRMVAERYTRPLACVRTFGCQQNVADSERLRGMLSEMGFGFTDSADLVIGLCGCMMQQEHIALRVRRSFPRTMSAPCAGWARSCSKRKRSRSPRMWRPSGAGDRPGFSCSHRFREGNFPRVRHALMLT